LVTFTFNTGVEATATRQIEITRDGIARTTYSINSPGVLEIRAESEAAQSDILRLDIPAPGEENITSTPTVEPTLTPTAIPPTETPLPPVAPAPVEPVEWPGLGDWIMAVLTASIMALIIYRLGALVGHVRWGVRAAFMVLIGGLTAYSYLVFRMREGELIAGTSISLNVFLATFAGGLVGLVIALAWRYIADISRTRQAPDGTDRTPSAH
jgi:hypothetical protein